MIENRIFQSGAVYHCDSTACYRLTADIDFSGINWSQALIPVFQGRFNGNHHNISHLTITGAGYLGLFGFIEDGGVENVIMANSDITGGDYTEFLGSLVGYRIKGRISNCIVKVNVSSGTESAYLGGLIGHHDSGIINDCIVTGNLTGSYSLGGLVGYCNTGSISDCYTNVSVRGKDNLGGLVGQFLSGSVGNSCAIGIITGEDNSSSLGGLIGQNLYGRFKNCISMGCIISGNNSSSLGGLVGSEFYGNINNCYATGNISGGTDSYFLGGLVGRKHISGNIKNCYFAGSVTGGDNSEYLGGLCGNNLGSIIDCYFLETAGPNNGYGEPLDDPNMMIQSSFVGWDFVGDDQGVEDHWQMCIDGYDYPRLAWEFVGVGDFLRPGRVDHYDLMVLAHDWLSTESRCGDINPPDGDGIVNILDYAEFAKYWLHE